MSTQKRDIGKLSSSKSIALAVICFLACTVLVVGCSTKQNNSTSRFYHNLTTRYNVYFHGKTAYDEAYKNLISGYKESYSEQIVIDPITTQAGMEKGQSGGAFNRSLEKGRKAIRYHSIRTKPEKKQGRLSPKEAEFFNRKEYNSFLHNAWFLVGQSQFYNANFLEAMATFAYMARLYSTQPTIRDEARLWQARCYIAMGWTPDSERILHTIDSTAQRYKNSIYPLVRTEQALATHNPQEALRFIPLAIKRESVGQQKARLHYLHGQLLEQNLKTQEARKAYGKVIASAPPYPLEFAARLQQTMLIAQGNNSSAIRQLNKMAKSDKNKDLLDAIYLAQGVLYLSAQDTTQAINAFSLGAEKSTAKEFDYLLCEVRRGDLFLLRGDYLKAQKAFAGAASVVNKEYHDYERIQSLSSQLDELGKHAQVIYEQDSLRHLASLPEAERLRLIDSAITDYKERKKEEEREAALQQQQAEQDRFNEEMNARNPNRSNASEINQPTTDNRFYFYNPQLIARGKNEFERKWGKRTLEDNWRRRTKQFTPSSSSTIAEPESAQGVPNASVPDSTQMAQQSDSTNTASDPTHRDFYLAQIPLTEEQKHQSDLLIQQAFVGQAEVFNVRMELFNEAIRSYLELLKRYPQYDDRISVYYSLYMLYQRLEQPAQARLWQQKMLAEYPKEDLTLAISDPNYIQNLRNNVGKEAQLYDQAFEHYLRGNTKEVHKAYQTLKAEYPLSSLLPQMTFLDALSYVLTGEKDQFQTRLQEITTAYNKAEIAILAQDILNQLLAGRALGRTGYTGLDRNRMFASDSIQTVSDSIHFTIPSPTAPHYALLIYPSELSLNINAMLFAIAGFNFSQFTRLDLDVKHISTTVREEFVTGVFRSSSMAWQYVRKAHDRSLGYMQTLPQEAFLIAIDKENLELLNRGASLEEYVQFVADSIAPSQPIAGVVLARRLELQQVQEDEDEDLIPQKADQESHQEPKASDSEKQPTAPLLFDIDRNQYNEKDTTVWTDSLKVVSPVDSLSTSLPNRQITVNKPLTPEDIKQMEQERKTKEREEAKAKDQEKREKEKQRKELEKQRNRERILRQREAEQLRKEKERQREAELKKREQERKQRQQQIERERRERLKERNNRQQKTS